MAHIYAMFLLAQFREKRAYPLIVDFFSAPGDIAAEATGDVVTEYLSRILASVCGGDVSLQATGRERSGRRVRPPRGVGISGLPGRHGSDATGGGAGLITGVCLNATSRKSLRSSGQGWSPAVWTCTRKRSTRRSSEPSRRT